MPAASADTRSDKSSCSGPGSPHAISNSGTCASPRRPARRTTRRCLFLDDADPAIHDRAQFARLTPNAAGSGDRPVSAAHARLARARVETDADRGDVASRQAVIDVSNRWNVHLARLSRRSGAVTAHSRLKRSAPSSDAFAPALVVGTASCTRSKTRRWSRLQHDAQAECRRESHRHRRRRRHAAHASGATAQEADSRAAAVAAEQADKAGQAGAVHTGRCRALPHRDPAPADRGAVGRLSAVRQRVRRRRVHASAPAIDSSMATGRGGTSPDMYSLKGYKLIELSTTSLGHARGRVDLQARVGWRDATQVAYHGLGIDSSQDRTQLPHETAVRGRQPRCAAGPLGRPRRRHDVRGFHAGGRPGHAPVDRRDPHARHRARARRESDLSPRDRPPPASTGDPHRATRAAAGCTKSRTTTTPIATAPTASIASTPRSFSTFRSSARTG